MCSVPADGLAPDTSRRVYVFHYGNITLRYMYVRISWTMIGSES